jgi:hypothetical protein
VPINPAKAKLLLGAGALGGGVALASLRGMGAAQQNQQQILDLSNQRRRDLSTPMPDFSAVKKAHEQFYEKSANDPLSFGGAVGMGAMNGVGKGVGDALGDILIRKPVDVVGKLLNKKFYTEPRQAKTFDAVLGSDEDLARANRENPAMLGDAHATLKKFAPSLTEDKNALRAYLRHAMVTGGTIDPATIKQLAESEKMYQQSRGAIK